MSKKNKKDFLTLKDYDSKTIDYLLDIAGDVKSDPSKYSKVLEGSKREYRKKKRQFKDCNLQQMWRTLQWKSL